MPDLTAAFSTVAIYVGLNIGILCWITIATFGIRGAHKTWVGSGGVPQIERIHRGHANAVEQMPMMMLALFAMAAMGAPAFMVHLMGLTFTIGRALHASHFIAADAPGWTRRYGFMLSSVAFLSAGVGVVLHGLWDVLT
ncbi:MAG: MAPEG family protein [Pseudomonadota bacterium]